MEWSDVSRLVGTAAPILGTLLGGPAGAAVGGLIASALGTPADADSVHAAIAADPEAALKLATVESDNRVKLQAMQLEHAGRIIAADTEQIKSNAADRDSARQREVSAKDTITPRLLALSVTIGFFGVLGFLLVNGKPAAGGDALMVMLGSLGAAWVSMVAYYFGTTSGAARTTELLASSTPGK